MLDITDKLNEKFVKLTLLAGNTEDNSLEILLLSQEIIKLAYDLKNEDIVLET